MPAVYFLRTLIAHSLLVLHDQLEGVECCE